MNKQKSVAGWLLILAALTFWISWFLMPDPGTTDTNHILNIVKANRTSVLSSVIIQVISSILYILALFVLSTVSRPKGVALTGIILSGIGVLGLCADAFFHLLAWFMTHESVTIQEDVVRVMEFMQTEALILLVPILLPFFFGSLVLAIGLNKQTLISGKATYIFSAVFLTGILGTAIGKMLDIQIPALMITVLGLFAIGQALVGLELMKPKSQPTFLTH